MDYVRRLARVAEREPVGGVQLIGVGRYEPADEPATAGGIERFRADVLADDQRVRRRFTSRTRVEPRATESGVTALRFRRLDAGAPPRSWRAG